MPLDDPVLTAWHAQLDAMERADADALRLRFAPTATITHMSRYAQPLDEWLAGIRSRRFVYRRLQERDAQVTERTATSARLVGHVTTGTAADGNGHPWPLRIEQSYTATEAGWLCTSAWVSIDSDR